jgi:hypothetical protein
MKLELIIHFNDCSIHLKIQPSAGTFFITEILMHVFKRLKEIHLMKLCSCVLSFMKLKLLKHECQNITI